MAVTVARRDLTRHQQKALADLGKDDALEGARVVGWDTSVEGPLVELAYDEGGFARVAISPRGRQIDRPERD